MKTLRANLSWFALLFSVIGLLPFASTRVLAQTHVRGEVQRGEHATTPPLRDIVPLQPKGEGHREKPLRLIVHPPKSPQTDPVVQSATSLSAPLASVGNIVSFDGLGVGGGYTPDAAPPDTNGAVGDTQYVQWVNESFAVYDKTSGAIVYGPAAGNTLFQALGASSPCAMNNDGDPIAQYDKQAKRWVMTQFSVTSGSRVGYWQCVAVSQTSDASGKWNVYGFNYGTTAFNDYPKLGVWNNGYYLTYNIFNRGISFAGSKICALDRTAMLNGTAANQVCYQLSSAYGGLLPADLDGLTAPPAGSPEYFLAFGTNNLLMWKLAGVNYSTGTATLTGPITIPVAAFNAACNGGGTCIPQIGTTQLLDSLADRLMYRLAYRNFGDHESLVVNHAVTAGTSVGIRWYELRNLGNSTPTVYQQGTYSPDAKYRWMGSAAMDGAGNLAIGYSLSSTSMNPAIRFTGRSAGDPLGTLGTPEIYIYDGAGSQSGGLSRWGDYSALSVDPVNDCTMWYTTEYLKNTGSFNWSTRIGYFKFSNCGATTNPDFAISASPSSQSVLQGGSTQYTVGISALDGFNGTVNLSSSGQPAGSMVAFNPTSVAGSGSSTMTVNVPSSVSVGNYTITITGTSGSITHSTTVALSVTTAPQPDFTIAASPSSQTVVAGAGTSYTATVAAVNGYSGTTTFSVSGLPSGAGGTFSPTSVTGSGSSTLSVTTSASVAAGTYPLTITASDGTLTHSTTVNLVVTSANADFAISATPSSATVTRGKSTTFTVTIGTTTGFTGTVSFSLTGLPNKTSFSFSPSTVTGSGSSVLTIKTNKPTSTGTYPLTITGTSGSLSHSTGVTLVVQ